MKRYTCLLILSLIVTSFTFASDWVVLGERKVDYRLDSDIIDIGKHEGPFNKIRLHVQDKPIRIFDLKVHFENGETYDVTIQRNFAEDEYSRVIDLPGRNRRINYVQLKYSTTRERRRGKKYFRKFEKATVRLLGRKGFSTPNYEYSLDWVKLGSKTVGRWNDRDTVDVGRRDGTFRAIRLQVLESNIYMKDFTVHFGNGQRLDVAVNSYMYAGQHTTTVDLPGSERYIEKIILTYSSLNRQRALVHVWGLQDNSRYIDNDKNRKQKRKQERKERKLTKTWELLGKETANVFTERDIIRVRGKKKFAKQIQLRINNEDVVIWDLKVHFENGSHADVSVRRPLRAGSVTRVIDLPGELRKIDRIQLLHRTQDSGNIFRQKKAVVEVWAK